MRVEVTEKRLSDTDATDDRHYLAFEGDVFTVPDALGKKWCELGWAKDLDGKVPTGQRIEGARALEPHPGKIGGK